MALENERDVIIGWKNGNKNAFETLVRHYRQDAFLVALGLVGDVEDARDLSQEAFIKAYQARERFDVTRPFFPWFYRILRNHCLNFIRRGPRRGGSLYFDGQPDRERFPSPEPTPLERLERDERHRLVRAAIDMLSDDHREIIVLKSFRGHTYQEIADILEIPIGTVMSRLYYARKALRDIVERLEREGVPRAAPSLEGSPTPGEVV